jgi:hypothetical protein
MEVVEWARYVACMEGMKKYIQSFSLKACRYKPLADLDVGGKMGVKQGVTSWLSGEDEDGSSHQ